MGGNTDNAEALVIPDDAPESAIREAVRAPEGSISRSVLGGLAFLSVDGAFIKSDPKEGCTS